MDARSERNLSGVHPALSGVVRAAHAALDGSVSFIVIEGLRTAKRQAELMASGATRTMNSRHLTGHAVDLMATVNGAGRWDWPLYAQLAKAMKAAAAAQGVQLVWGGDWRTFKDGPHFELDRQVYSA